MGNRALQPVSINGIEFDALISSTESYEASVPEYPVETGFTVSDTVILNAETLEMTLFLSNRPVTWVRRFGASANRVGQVTRQLRELYFQKSLVTVSTGSGSYTNMAITSLSIPRSNSMMDAVEIPIKFKKVRVTASRTAVIPDSYGKSGATAAPSGTANTSAASAGASGGNEAAGGDAQGSSSVAYGIASKFGLFK